MQKKYMIYKYFVVVFSIITFFVSLIIDKDSGYKYVPIIPLFYLIFFIFFKRIHRYSAEYKGLFLLNIFMFIKYVVAIFLVCVFKNFDIPNYYAVNVTEESYYFATLLIIIEMLTIFFTIELFSDKLYKKVENIETENSIYEKSKIGPFMILFFVISIILIFFNWNLFINKSLIIFSDNNAVTETIETNNAISMVFNAVKIITMGLLINRFIRRYMTTKKRKYIVFSYIAILLHVFLSISTSRINMLLPFVLFVILTRNIFGKFGKKLNIICVVLLLSLFSIVSAYKNPWQYEKSSSSYQSIIKFSTGIQEYTSNVFPTAMGIQAINYYGGIINVGTLFNDVMGSVPFVSHYINQDNRIYRLYNAYALKENTMSQLIPLSVSSMAYFSMALCWVLVFFNVVLLMYFDKIMKVKKRTFLEEYISLYLLFIFASCIYSNVQILSGRFFVNFLPVFLIISINKKITIKNNNAQI